MCFLLVAKGKTVQRDLNYCFQKLSAGELKEHLFISLESISKKTFEIPLGLYFVVAVDFLKFCIRFCNQINHFRQCILRAIAILKGCEVFFLKYRSDYLFVNGNFPVPIVSNSITN